MAWSRVLVGALVAVFVVVFTAGCVTKSPPEQGERERKAASVPAFKLHMTQDLWERTNVRQSAKLVREPKKVTDLPGGMVTVELTGPQMVDYLQGLDYNAHGGGGAKDESLAEAVYDTVAPVLDRIESPPPAGAPIPEITVHAAVGAATSTTAPAPPGR
ncbi:hypothetical protein [Nocardia testacea]|uniref:hypothetical protein n=1 Tax=Nocardia testacea TaxID=248551 RepID=UPI0033D76347